MPFDNKNIKIYDMSIWQTIMFDSNGNLLPPDRQKHINFNKVRDIGKALAVILKAGQYYYKDPAFDIGWRNAKLAGLPRSSYWFLSRYDTGKNQAKKYWEYLKSDIGEGMHFCDFEYGSGNDWNQVYSFISEFQQLSQLPDYKIGVYTGYYYWTQYAPSTNAQKNWFAKYPLWLAYYTANSANIRIPLNWMLETLLLWQWGTPPIGMEIGCWSREVDANLLNGGQEKLNKYFGVSNTTSPSFPYSLVINNKEYRTVG